MNSVYSSVAAPSATPRRRWTTAAASVLLHTALAFVVAYAGRAAIMQPEAARVSLTFVPVVLPEAPPPPRQPMRLPPVLERAVTPEPRVALPEIEEPPVPERAEAPIEAPRPVPEPRRERPVALDRPRVEPPVVQVGAFASVAPVSPAALPSRVVQQAGFDTSDAREAGPSKATAVVGAFEQPSGGSKQPGTGRPNGVSDAGFGTGAASGPAGSARGGRAVAVGGLDAGGGGGARAAAPQTVKATEFDARVAPAAAPRALRAAPTEIPVEIVSKPTPEYSDEARALKIEGEVVLEVEFASTGDIRVLRVVRGLGHGLDERATQAVQSMRFRPARREGQPVDVRTTVSIVFRLA